MEDSNLLIAAKTENVGESKMEKHKTRTNTTSGRVLCHFLLILSSRSAAHSKLILLWLRRENDESETESQKKNYLRNMLHFITSLSLSLSMCKNYSNRVHSWLYSTLTLNKSVVLQSPSEDTSVALTFNLRPIM